MEVARPQRRILSLSDFDRRLSGRRPHDADFLERLKSYLIKAVREAKVHTEWLKPDMAYEEAFANFARSDPRVLGRQPVSRRVCCRLPISIAYCGMFNSLAQTLVKIVAPGVPDIYQGTELWDLSFVDPDNRRDVDFADRRRLLAELKSAEAEDRIALLRDLLSHGQDGRVKLYLMYKLLSFRRAHAESFHRRRLSPAREPWAR